MVENKLSIFQRSEIEWMEVKGDEFILSRKRTKLEIEQNAGESEDGKGIAANDAE